MTVAAITAVLGGQKTLRRKVSSVADLTSLTRQGLPVDSLTSLATQLSVERRTLARAVGISDRTLSRRLAGASRLSADESDKVVRLARIVAKALDTFGTSGKASHWLLHSNLALGGEAPLNLLDTDTGVHRVETILGRIDFGIYS